MQKKSDFYLNALLALLAILACVTLPVIASLVMCVVVIIIHSRQFIAQEWRLYIQITVLAWVIDALFVRMQLMAFAEPYFIYAHSMSWAMLATTFCHSLYKLIKNPVSAALLGASYGVFIFIVPTVVLGRIHALSSITLFIASSALAGMLLLTVFSFVVRLRLLPQAN